MRPNPVPKISAAFAAFIVPASIPLNLSVNSKNAVSKSFKLPLLSVTEKPRRSKASLAVPIPSLASCIFFARVGNALCSALKSVPANAADCLNLSNKGTLTPVAPDIFSNLSPSCNTSFPSFAKAATPKTGKKAFIAPIAPVDAFFKRSIAVAVFFD